MNEDLPKWSRIVISGKKITEEQAYEIIIRTDDLYFSTNDCDWRKQLYQCLGIKNLDNYFPDFNELQAIKEKLGSLDINYLYNRQIASSYIFGPHGWCSWNGDIGCDGYNIGKYPSVDSVLKEWKLIANTWKFLELNCQLWNCEYGEEGKPVVEFIIKNGEVIVNKPNSVLFHRKTTCDEMRAFYYNGERGCTIDLFFTAVKICQNRNV